MFQAAETVAIAGSSDLMVIEPPSCSSSGGSECFRVVLDGRLLGVISRADIGNVIPGELASPSFDVG